MLIAVFGILFNGHLKAQTVIKQLYLGDPAQVLDRIDPVATADATLAQTAGLTPTSRYLYVLRGASRTDFWRYDITTDTWAVLAPTPAIVSSGGALATDGNEIYALLGSSNQFWRYNTLFNFWWPVSTTPASTGGGSAIVYLNGSFYAFRGGNTNTFWRYTIATNLWTAVANAPGTVNWGGALTTDGTNIYATQGGTANFWRYNVATNTWSSMAAVPGAVGAGGSLSFDGTGIFALRGNNLNNFYRYNIASNSWTSLTNVPGGPLYGGCMVSDDPLTYVLRGNNDDKFWSWNGTTWNSPTKPPARLDSGGAVIKMGVVPRTVTFTQTPTLCSPLTIKAANTITVRTYVSSVYGTIPVNPSVTATLRYGTTNIITLTNPVYNSATSLITWTGMLSSDVTVPTGQAIALDISTSMRGISFRIDYDHQSKPSRIDLPVSTFINVNSVAIFDVAFPGGTQVSTVLEGSTRYVRTTVTDPFGFSDIRGADITITPPGTTTAGTSVYNLGCTRIYQNVWSIPAGFGSYTVSARAKEGYENTVTHTNSTNIATCVNCPPTAYDDTRIGFSGEPLDVNVLANDTDPNNNIDSASLTIISNPKNGDAIIDDNRITYLPNGTFTGNDTLIYQICDQTSPVPLCATARVIVTITPNTFNTCDEVNKAKIYYMPYSENEAQVALVKSSSVVLPTTDVRTIISIKVTYPAVRLVWDNWEDGYEADILNPVQASTEVWGDGNIYNGAAPGYPTDVIPPGGNIVLDNTMPTPRVAANIFYDGRDKLYSSSQISVTQVCGEPGTMAVQCMKTNVSAYPSEFGELFYLPVGENLPSRDFRYTALFIRAAHDNTYVQIDRDADSDFETNFVLNEGQVMRVDNATAPAGTQLRAGAVITADKLIGVDAHFAGVDNYSSREIPLYPSSWYSHTYYTPVPTTGPAVAPHDTAAVMFYNSLNRNITINWSSGIPSSGSFVLGANTSYRFTMPLSATAAYKFVNPTKESFVAMEIVDSYTPGGGGNDGATRDWAFNLISEARLTDFGSIAWGPGSTNGTRNDNPIWVTPTAATTVYVKYDGDVINGPLTSPCGLKYDVSYSLSALNHLRIKDNLDNDQSGTAVYTCNGAKIALVYGEDPATALTANPSWDVGTTIQPFCKEKKVLANTDYSITLVNTPVTINVLGNDAGFLAVINAASLNTTGFPQATNGVVTVNADGTITYMPNPGFAGVDSFIYNVCSTPFPVVCGSAVVYVTINACPSPTGMNVITGQVFLDRNEDATNNDGGSGFSPAKVYLYTDGNCNGSINPNELIDSANVDANGMYQFIKSPEKIIADNFDLPGGVSSCATGSDGLMPWNNNWLDTDVSSGFCVSPAPADTDVEIMKDSIYSFALRIDDVNTAAIREFNMQYATKAFLSFSYRKANTNLTTNESIAVQLSSDGITYNTVYTIAGNGTFNPTYVNVPNIRINAPLYNTTNRTFLRILTNNRVDEGDFVFFDNFEIKFTQYDQCYMVALNTAALPSNSQLTTAPLRSFTFNTSGTCENNVDFGVIRISTYAANDENSTWKDVNVNGNVTLNDYDQEGNVQTFGSFLNPTTMAVLSSGAIVSGVDKSGSVVANAGTITFDGNGNYTFDPSVNFTGTVSIPYSICDNVSTPACDTAYLSITVDPLPATGNSVIANNDEDISYGAAITGNLLVNDRDPKNYTFSVSLFRYDTNGDGIPDVNTLPGTVTVAGVNIFGSPVANAGTLTINANGNYTFTPAAGFTGSVNAFYTITNSSGAQSLATIHFEVLANTNGIQNDPPFAGDDFGYTTVNKAVTASFINNDKDYNNDSLSLNGVTLSPSAAATPVDAPVNTAQGGTVQFYSNGTYTYTPPTGYIGPDIVTYTICDVTNRLPQPQCANATLHLLVGPGISISGMVWDDGNGNVVPELGFENATNASSTLYVNLVDALGYVVATAPVASDGSYIFDDVAPGNNYSLVLSTINGITGTPAPNATLPMEWVNTGETRNGIIDNGAPGVIDNRYYGFANVVNMDFGIEQLPTSVPIYVNIDEPVVGQVITLNGNGTNPPTLSGKDAEDCTSGCTLDTRNVVIDVIPNNADLYYNGVLVTAGQLIINFDPNLLSIHITSATIGTKSTEFYYSYVDSAGKKDPITAIYSINWFTLLPVKDLQLSAVKAGRNTVLNWKTITEMNSTHFEIERSTDGRNYTKQGADIAASGNTIGEKAYTTTDDIGNVSVPVVYYRVKLVDKAGKYAYSNVVAVKLPENGALIKVVPNPFISELTITISTDQPNAFAIRMLDMSGRTIYNNNQKITRESPTITLRNLGSLIRGMYIVEITDAATGKKNIFKVEKAY